MPKEPYLYMIENTMNLIEKLSDELGYPITKDDYYIEDMGCPHKQPTQLRTGYSAVYIFIHVMDVADDEVLYQFLKIGKANSKSGARFVSQHYGFSTPSTLAKSLCSDPEFQRLGVCQATIKEWMFKHLARVNIMIKNECGKAATELIESIMHYHLRPKYEGNI